MKRFLIFLLLIILAMNVYGQQADRRIKIDQSADSFYVMTEQNITLEKEGKTLCMMLNSLENSSVSEDITGITLKIENNVPTILIDAGDTITIKQETTGYTEVHFSVPNNLDEKTSLIYLTEHYIPDKELVDSSRLSGIRKIAAISKESTASINVKSLLGNKEKLTLNLKEFLESKKGTEQKGEFDILKEGRATEMFFYENSLIVRSYNFMINMLFDRGFTSGELLKEPAYNEFEKTEDQYPETCTKLAVIFNETNYNVSEVSRLTNGQGIIFFISDDPEKITTFTEEASSEEMDMGLIITYSKISVEMISIALENISSDFYINVQKDVNLSYEELDKYANFSINLKSRIQNANIISDLLNERELQYLSGNQDFINSINYIICKNCTADEASYIENTTGKQYGLVQMDYNNELAALEIIESKENLESILNDDSISVYGFGSSIFNEDNRAFTEVVIENFCNIP